MSLFVMSTLERATCLLLIFSILSSPALSIDIPRIACEKGDTVPQQRVITTERLRALRSEMRKVDLAAFLVPSTDPHLNEYAGPEFARLKWISGFSGSQGHAMVMLEDAVLGVDSRYIIQANLQMDCNWNLVAGRRVWSYLRQYIRDRNLKNVKVGVDTRLLSEKNFQMMEHVASSMGASILTFSSNLIDKIWTDRPLQNSKTLFVHPLKYAGETWQKKVQRVRWTFTSARVNTLLVTKLDEIAWLFNIRGSAIPYNTVFYAYAVIKNNSINLFVKNTKEQSSKIRSHLNSDSVEFCPPDQTCVRLRDYDEDFPRFLDEMLKDASVNLWLSESSSNAYLINKLKPKIVATTESPIYSMKVIKNPVEEKSFEKCTHIDSAAYVEFMDFLFKAMGRNEGITEVSAAMKLEQFRRRYDNYHGPSFETISSSGPNAAMNHYTPTNLTDRRLSQSEIYLLDAGSQFLGCTTDVTRTVHFGTPTAKMIEAYTRVLAGFIDVATSVWPKYTENEYLAIYARRSLWQNGLDYGHGTGHGIGTFLNVHEFPNGLMRGQSLGSYTLRKGNYQSCEPGYYEDGEFGIRLETVLGVKNAKTKYRWNDNSYLTFFPVAFIPFERKLIDTNLLSRKQLEWLNNYHRQCLKVVGDILQSVGRPEALVWLKEKTAAYPVGVNSGRKTGVNIVLLLVLCFLQKKLS